MGLALGGGIGLSMRAHGLVCDSILGVQLVLANGSVVRLCHFLSTSTSLTEPRASLPLARASDASNNPALSNGDVAALRMQSLKSMSPLLNGCMLYICKPWANGFANWNLIIMYQQNGVPRAVAGDELDSHGLLLWRGEASDGAELSSPSFLAGRCQRHSPP